MLQLFWFFTTIITYLYLSIWAHIINIIHMYISNIAQFVFVFFEVLTGLWHILKVDISKVHALRILKSSLSSEKFYHPPTHLSQNFILGKKWGTPQIRQKSNQICFDSNFHGDPSTMKEWDWGWKILLPLAKIWFWAKRGWEHPKSGKNSTNSDSAQTFKVTSGQ